MEIMEYLVYPLAALITLVVGAVWYNPSVMGNAWMKASGMTKEMAESGNMIKIFGLTFLFGLFISASLLPVVIHQANIQSLLGFQEGFGVEGGEAQVMFDDIMEKYGDEHRHFGHGALHGGIVGIIFAWPLIGIIALFERRSWKYTGIHAGYWIITLSLMGGLISQFAGV
jgi:hypothetical protein